MEGCKGCTGGSCNVKRHWPLVNKQPPIQQPLRAARIQKQMKIKTEPNQSLNSTCDSMVQETTLPRGGTQLSECAKQRRYKDTSGPISEKMPTAKEFLNSVPQGVVKQKWHKQEIIEREYKPNQTLNSTCNGMDTSEVTSDKMPTLEELLSCVPSGVFRQRWVKHETLEREYSAPPGWTQQQQWKQSIDDDDDDVSIIADDDRNICVTEEISSDDEKCPGDTPSEYEKCPELAVLLALILLGSVVVGEKDGVRTFVFANEPSLNTTAVGELTEGTDKDDSCLSKRRQWTRSPEPQTEATPAAWAQRRKWPSGPQPQTETLPAAWASQLAQQLSTIGQNDDQPLGVRNESRRQEDRQHLNDTFAEYKFSDPAALCTTPRLQDLVGQGGLYASSVAQKIMKRLLSNNNSRGKRGTISTRGPVAVPRPPRIKQEKCLPPPPPPGRILKVAAPRAVLKPKEVLPPSIPEPRVQRGVKSHSEFRKLMYPMGNTSLKSRLTINNRGQPEFVPLADEGNVQMKALERCDSYKRFMESESRKSGQSPDQWQDQFNQRIYVHPSMRRGQSFIKPKQACNFKKNESI